MYTTEQISKLRKKFWTIFGQYMKPVPGASGEAVNWLNYKTGIRNIYFRMDANQQSAHVGIELLHSMEVERLQCYDQFVSLKKLLEKTTGTSWQWQAAAVDEDGRPISRISRSLESVNILQESDWPAMITFLKEQITSLDTFWDTIKDGFD